MIPNPSITNPDAMTILLMWSPPFLWRGSSIEYFNISVTNSHGHQIYYHVNASFSDAVVFFEVVANESQNMQTCDELRFAISAISTDLTTLESYVITGGYIPSNHN